MHDYLHSIYPILFRDFTNFLRAALPAAGTDEFWEQTAQESIRLTSAYRSRPEYPFCCAVMEAILYELARVKE